MTLRSTMMIAAAPSVAGEVGDQRYGGVCHAGVRCVCGSYVDRGFAGLRGYVLADLLSQRRIVFNPEIEVIVQQ